MRSYTACSREGIRAGEGPGITTRSRGLETSVPVSDHPETSGKVPGGLGPGLRAGPGDGAGEGACDREGAALSLRTELDDDAERDLLNKRTRGRSFLILICGTDRLT